MPKLLPKNLFLETFRYAPRAAVSLVVENKKHEILLARRAIAPKKGYWHLPGGFVLKGEAISHCIARVAKKEFGLTIDPASAKLAGISDDLHEDPRGHVIDIIYAVKTGGEPQLTEETEEIKFFKKLPPLIGFNHRNVLRTLGYK